MRVNNLLKYLLWVLLSSLLITCTQSDSNPVESGSHQRGQIIDQNNIGLLSVNEIQQIFTNSNTTLPFNLSYSVKVIAINYVTVDRNEVEKIVSGAIFIPQGINNLPLLSLQHGTQSKSDLVASVSPSNSVEGTIALLTASLGYITVVPDYIGLGISNEMHPYLHAKSLISSVIDMMRAGKIYCSENQLNLDGRVYLMGYSEGGYASLLTQKEIEENHISEFNLTGVAPLAGPYDLKGTIDSAFISNNYGGDPAYIGYFFTAYNEIYGWNRLNDIFVAPYASMMHSLYDGTKSWGEILNQLPASFSELVKPEFVSKLFKWK